LEEEEIKALLPAFIIDSRLTGRRLVSLPFSDHCTPLLKDVKYKEELFKFVIEYLQSEDLKFVEFKSLQEYLLPNEEDFRKDYIHNLRINLPEKVIFNSFSDNTKRNIKKAIKNNLMISISNNSDGMLQFYRMNCITRKKHGLPPQPYYFFRNIFDHIINQGFGDIILSHHNDKVISGSIYFKIGKKIIYKYGASYPDYFEFRGNHFVMWEAIKKYSNEGYENFDFGRTEFKHEGLRKFKLSWGSDESFIYTQRIDAYRSTLLIGSKTNGLHNNIFRYTPIAVLNLISKLFYKHIA
jgi:lipid II:glycine glycyltransferase (peptidoglycan interpeptide bridge formation enzyme)